MKLRSRANQTNDLYGFLKSGAKVSKDFNLHHLSFHFIQPQTYFSKKQNITKLKFVPVTNNMYISRIHTEKHKKYNLTSNYP